MWKQVQCRKCEWVIQDNNLVLLLSFFIGPGACQYALKQYLCFSITPEHRKELLACEIQCALQLYSLAMF